MGAIPVAPWWTSIVVILNLLIPVVVALGSLYRPWLSRSRYRGNGGKRSSVGRVFT